MITNDKNCRLSILSIILKKFRLHYQLLKSVNTNPFSVPVYKHSQLKIAFRVYKKFLIWIPRNDNDNFLFEGKKKMVPDSEKNDSLHTITSSGRFVFYIDMLKNEKFCSLILIV